MNNNIDNNISSIFSNLSESNSEVNNEVLIPGHDLKVDKNIESIFNNLQSNFDYEKLFRTGNNNKVNNNRVLNNEEKLRLYGGNNAEFVGDINLVKFIDDIKLISKNNNINFNITKKNPLGITFILFKNNEDKKIEIELTKSGKIILSFIVDIEEIKREEKNFIDNKEVNEYIEDLIKTFDSNFIVKLIEEEKIISYSIDYDWLRAFSFILFDIVREKDWEFIRELTKNECSFIIIFNKLDLDVKGNFCHIKINTEGKLIIEGTYNSKPFSIDKDIKETENMKNVLEKVIEEINKNTNEKIEQDFNYTKENNIMFNQNVKPEILNNTATESKNKNNNINNSEFNIFLSKPDIDY